MILSPKARHLSFARDCFRSAMPESKLSSLLSLNRSLGLDCIGYFTHILFDEVTPKVWTVKQSN